jgi:aminopeptidase N
MRHLFQAFALALLFAACAPAKLSVEKGVTEELARERKSVVSNIIYDLNFSIPASLKEPVTGAATIRFDLKSVQRNLQFDFKGDTTVKYSVSVNGKSAETGIQNGHLVISKSDLKVGTNEIKLHYRSPDWSLNRNPEFLYTLFVPDRASTAFPCFDQPDLKAQFKLHLDIPAEWKAVANEPLEKEIVSGAVKTLDFKLTKPLPTYLFAFSAGKFDTISQTKNGKTVVLYHREKEEELKNNVDSIFALVFNSLQWIENYTGIPYPFEKYDLVAIPSFQYSGMEHPGATLYKASSLFLDKKPTQQQLLKRANLIAHETAHMWFGDMVTMPWFNEVWMKEVFANFIADKVVTPMFPQFNFDLQFLLAHYDVAYSIDRTLGANAIGQKLANMMDAGSLYGAIIYHKAPIVMRMLEQKIGETTLQKGLQQYLSENAYGNASWQDLIDILNTSKTDELPGWSASWVEEAGRPTINARIEGKDLIVEQHDPNNRNRIWPMEIDLAFAENGKIGQQKVILNSSSTTLKDLFSESKPEWLYPNAKGNDYGFVEMDSATARYFMRHFAEFKDDVLRASALTDLTENLYKNKIATSDYLKFMVGQLPAENNSVIFERMLTYLESSYLYKATAAGQNAIQEELEAALWKEYAARKSQQTALINCLMKIAKTQETLVKLEECLNTQILHTEIKLSADQQNELAYQLALKQPEKAIQILNDQEKRISNPDKKAQFAFVRKSLNPDKAERDRFFESLLQEENREHEPWVDQAMAFLNHPSRQTEAVKYIRPALEELQEIQRTGDIFFPKSWLDNLLKGHNSKEAAAVVGQFLTDHPNYPESLKMKILQSADHLLQE